MLLFLLKTCLDSLLLLLLLLLLIADIAHVPLIPPNNWYGSQTVTQSLKQYGLADLTWIYM